MKIPAYLKFLLFAISMHLMGCGDKKSPPPIENSTGDVNVEENQPEQIDPLEEARAKILGILENYYEDLSRENMDENKYFAPTVRQFFSSTDLPRSRVGESLRNGFKTIEDRIVDLDQSSLKVREQDGGYMAEFTGNTSFTRTNTGEKVSQPFANRIYFDDSFLITRYQAVESNVPTPQSARSLAARSAADDAMGIASAILTEFKSGSYRSTPDHIHPDLGFYLIGAPGAYRVPYFMQKFDEIFTHAPWLREGLEIEILQPESAPLPSFSCDKLFSKEGCFIEEVSDYDNVSSLMTALIRADFDIFNDETISQAKTIENMVQVAVVETHANLALYLGKSGSKWYLLIVDMASYDCSA